MDEQKVVKPKKTKQIIISVIILAILAAIGTSIYCKLYISPVKGVSLNVYKQTTLIVNYYYSDNFLDTYKGFVQSNSNTESYKEHRKVMDDIDKQFTILKDTAKNDADKKYINIAKKVTLNAPYWAEDKNYYGVLTLSGGSSIKEVNAELDNFENIYQQFKTAKNIESIKKIRI